MSDKIEDWIQRANDIAMHIAELQARAAMYDTETLHNAWKKQKAALDTHLRTTPEGYRLVDQRENEALRKDAERYRWLRRKMCFNGNGDGTATMHAINLPNATKFPDVGEVEIGVDAAIDAALQEQSKC